MRLRRVHLGMLVLAGCLAAASYQAVAAKGSSKRIDRVGLGTGYRPPTFSARDLKGKAQSLAEAPGAVTVLHFWASWCPYCRNEIPELTQLHAKGAGVKVLTVSVDQDLAALKQFVSRYNLPYPIVADLETDPSLADQFGVSGIPVTFIISSDGYIVEKINGAGDISAAVDVALKP